MTPMSFRTPETERRYQEDKAAGKTIPLDKVGRKKEFKYFYIIHNDYPYDGVNLAGSCDMLVIRRDGVAKLSEFTPPELLEYIEIEEGYVNERYDHLQKNTSRTMSQPGRWHCHLLNKVASRKDVRL